MPELILRLRTDPVTGRRELSVSYRSDADALPMEHEEEHRHLVDGILEGGAAGALAEGRLELEREAAGQASEAGKGEAAPQRRALEEKE